ncbi:MAG: hypothetical protein JWM96_541 [Alphaproteobacteria bacterium]|nr:hypothetical protein [Alphaproteobacteria bacterium]
MELQKAVDRVDDFKFAKFALLSGAEYTIDFIENPENAQIVALAKRSLMINSFKAHWYITDTKYTQERVSEEQIKPFLDARRFEAAN